MLAFLITVLSKYSLWLLWLKYFLRSKLLRFKHVFESRCVLLISPFRDFKCLKTLQIILVLLIFQSLLLIIRFVLKIHFNISTWVYWRIFEKCLRWMRNESSIVLFGISLEISLSEDFEWVGTIIVGEIYLEILHDVHAWNRFSEHWLIVSMGVLMSVKFSGECWVEVSHFDWRRGLQWSFFDRRWVCVILF